MTVKRFLKLKPHQAGYQRGYRYLDWKTGSARKTKPTAKQLKQRIKSL